MKLIYETFSLLFLLFTSQWLLVISNPLNNDHSSTSHDIAFGRQLKYENTNDANDEFISSDSISSNSGEYDLQDDKLGIDLGILTQGILLHDEQKQLDELDDALEDGSDETEEIDAALENEDAEQQETKNSIVQTNQHDWDLLIFTQQWPVTTCYHWREEDKTHACALPAKKEFWTIHGIWPTKLGQFGPSFCNRSADFDIKELNSIMDTLKIYWPDIDGETENHDWLWKHEWLKHGTCASLVETLNDEFKYFHQGVQWRSEYSISNILSDSNIHPDSNNTIEALQMALVKTLGKNPSIHCLYDSKTEISYLAEIRICFDKELKLIDCDGVKLDGTKLYHMPYNGISDGIKVNTNCHLTKLIHYPSIVPIREKELHDKEWKFPIVNIYKLVQFIMWFTL